MPKLFFIYINYNTNLAFFIPVNLTFKWYNIRSKKSSLPKKQTQK